MCVVSMVQQGFYDKWKDQYDQWPQQPQPREIQWDKNNQALQQLLAPKPDLAKEIESLRAMMLEQKALLELLIKRAKEYDERTGQPDCGLEDKQKALQDLADKMGLGQIKFD